MSAVAPILLLRGIDDITFTFQWQFASDLAFTQNVTNISGANADWTLIPEAPDNLYIRLAVTATDQGVSAVAYSNVLGPVAALPLQQPLQTFLDPTQAVQPVHAIAAIGGN